MINLEPSGREKIWYPIEISILESMKQLKIKFDMLLVKIRSHAKASFLGKFHDEARYLT